MSLSRQGGCALLACVLVSATVAAEPHLQRIRKRGSLTCGVAPGVAGFAREDGHGRFTGLDVDICRAIAAAIFGSADKVRFVPAPSVSEFLRSKDIDVVSRRLTWSIEREGLGLLFGPVTFYDGQGFLVPRARQITSPSELAAARICIVPGAITEFNLNAYFQSRNIAFTKVLLRTLDRVEGEFAAGRCDALTGDVSELGSVRSLMNNGDQFEILAERISKEPMAQVVRQGDDQFFNILRWTVFAMIAAEESGVTSANVADMTAGGSDDLDVKRLLGVIPGNGRALGLDEKWAYHVIRTVGNYGEVFERNVGKKSPIRFERGLNALWTDGGLMYAPQFRR
jgi:general L-amino acid transport system substrate-binding protein